MKKFLRIVGAMKFNACLCFTGWMVLMTLGYTLFGKETVTVSLLWQFLILSAFSGILQVVAFSELVFHKLRYSLRMLVFCLPFLALLSLCAWMFQWFPTGQLISWLIFLGIFLGILVLMTVGFEIGFRCMGKRYDGLLNEYHAKAKKNAGKS